MSRREAFIAGMKSQLDKWGAELNKLEVSLENAEAHIRERYRHAVGPLREKHRAIEAKLEQLGHGRDESWEELRDEVERIWAAFKAGLDALREFSDHS